jgi:YVTN family beta-propeller protein
MGMLRRDSGNLQIPWHRLKARARKAQVTKCRVRAIHATIVRYTNSKRSANTCADVPTGKKPDAIIFDPATSRVFAFNGESNSATAIDAATGRVAGTVDLGGGPEFAVADGKGYVFDNLEDEGLVLKIDARKLTVEQRWPTAPCAKPSSLAMDRENRRLFVGCRSKVMAVMNADTGQVITTLPIGDHVDATAFDPEIKLIFNSNGEGTVTAIHQDGPDSTPWSRR